MYIFFFFLGQDWEKIRSSFLGSGIGSQAQTQQATITPQTLASVGNESTATNTADGNTTTSGATSTGGAGGISSTATNGGASTGGASTTGESSGGMSTMGGSTFGVNLVFSNRKGGHDVVIKEKGSAFSDVNIPRGTAVMKLDLKIPDNIKSLGLSAQAANKDVFMLNGKETLDVDVKVLPSVIIVHEKGKFELLPY